MEVNNYKGKRTQVLNINVLTSRYLFIVGKGAIGSIVLMTVHFGADKDLLNSLTYIQQNIIFQDLNLISPATRLISPTCLPRVVYFRSISSLHFHQLPLPIQCLPSTLFCHFSLPQASACNFLKFIIGNSTARRMVGGMQGTEKCCHACAVVGNVNIKALEQQNVILMLAAKQEKNQCKNKRLWQYHSPFNRSKIPCCVNAKKAESINWVLYGKKGKTNTTLIFCGGLQVCWNRNG